MKVVPKLGYPTPPSGYYVVYVCSMTYNQSLFIEDCLNGVAMQITDFPLVHHVIDDCSTDGEQEVINSWIRRNCDLNTVEYYENDICTITLIKAKNNPNYTLAAYFLKRNLYKAKEKKQSLCIPWRNACPYEAICEGDDFWTDPNKLQKQVDFLKANPEYSMCCSAYSCICQETGELVDRNLTDLEVITFDDLLDYNKIGTLTVLRRKILLQRYYKEFEYRLPAFPLGDYQQWLWMSKQGPIYRFKERMAMYRLLNESASHSKSPLKRYCFALACIDIRLIFNREFGSGIFSLYFRRIAFIVFNCIKHRWYKLMFKHLFHPDYILQK